MYLYLPNIKKGNFFSVALETHPGARVHPPHVNKANPNPICVPYVT